MYTTSTRYGLPRTTSYSSSSRYSSVASSSLPPVYTRYTPSRYSSYSTSTVSLPRHSTISSLSSTRYTKSPSLETTGWKPSTSTFSSASPSLTRKSSISLLTRRPSYSSFNDLGYYSASRSGSVSSLSSSSTDNYRSGSTPASYVSSTTGVSDVWVPRSRRLNSVSSTDTPDESEHSYSSYSPSYRSPVQTNSSKLAARGGLRNLGNTCFMNAVLQCLCHTKPLLDYCLRGSFARERNLKSQNGGKLIEAFAKVVNHMWRNKASNISPSYLKKELEKYAPQFLGCNQQDAQELLRYLLQGLHEDINRGKPTKASGSGQIIQEGHTESVQANASWRQYLSAEDSKIVELFCGQLKSTLKCTQCGNISTTFDPFWDLSLPIPEILNRVTLQSCLKLFSTEEMLQGSEMPVCSRCKKKTPCTKQLVIVRCPKILVIHLKRFGHRKILVNVDSPENLDISNFVSSYGDGGNLSTAYNLYGVVDHIGNMSGGHYTAKCKSPYEGDWNEFNDVSVSPISSTNLVTEKAYLLFYEQKSSWNSRL